MNHKDLIVDADYLNDHLEMQIYEHTQAVLAEELAQRKDLSNDYFNELAFSASINSTHPLHF